MSEMGLHDPFGHLKHKLWSNEELGVKLVIWFLTIKSRELTRFPFLQVACHIPLKTSRWGLQLCCRPHLNQRSEEKIMGPQSCGSPKLENFETRLPLGSFGTKNHFDVAPWRGTKYIIRGKVMDSPKSGPWWILWVQVAHDSS
jgi:hypothetical protein